MQSKRHSALEAGVNTVVGLVVSISANMLVLPWFGYTPGLVEASKIGVAFTGISLIRGYLVRRLFNRRRV